MIYNYHTHTYRCSHATGTVEEYIKRAIDGGIKYMGFSDHIPFAFPDGHESSYRVPFDQAEEYFAEIDELRKKYKNEIDIKIGFEMEYYPNSFDKMLKIAVDFGAEYLILGQHYLKEEYPDSIYTILKTEKEEYIKEYTDCVIAAIKSGVFTYVAHPDIMNFVGDTSIYIKEMRRICVASREFDVPLEINFLGIRKKRIYPNDLFWKIAGEEKSPVTFGFDAHDVLNAFDEASIAKAEDLVKKYNLNYIGKPNLKSVKLTEMIKN